MTNFKRKEVTSTVGNQNNVLTVNIHDYVDKSGESNLWTYFRRVVKGENQEIRTNFYGKSTPLKDILNGWQPVLEHGLKMWPSLLQFENDLREKVGPMSIMKPLSERMDDIRSYYDLISKDQTDIAQAAIDAVLREYQAIRGLRRRDDAHTLRNMRKSTSSGLPFFTRKNRVLDKILPCEVDEEWMTIQGRKWKQAALLGWRGQEGGATVDDTKQRVVWMFPFADNIKELSVYQPLIIACQKMNYVPAWVGMDAVDRAVTSLFDSKDPNDYIVCTDFEKFDQHFNPTLQATAQQLLEGLFTRGPLMDDWFEHVFPIKYNIPMMFDFGKIFVGKHGMASGSGGTNADETLVHRALQYEAAIKSGSHLNPYSQCLGDDGVLSFPGINVDNVIDTYTAHGLDMNSSKQYVSKHDLTYLRRWHHESYRINGICAGVYSTYRALGRLAEQERYYDPSVWGPKMVALRQLSIIENCKYHPLFQSFVDYCMKGDKYRLGLDIPGFMDNLALEASEATDLMPEFLGYTRSLSNTDPTRGIDNWAVVQYLRSKK